MSDTTAPETPPTHARTVHRLCIGTGLAVVALAVLRFVWLVSTQNSGALDEVVGGGDIARSLLAAVLYLLLGLVLAVQSGSVVRDPAGAGARTMHGLAVALLAILVADAIATYLQASRLSGIEQTEMVKYGDYGSVIGEAAQWAAALGFAVTVVAALALVAVVQFNRLATIAAPSATQGDTPE